MKRAIFLAGGLCWFLFAIGFGLLLLRYATKGAGLQFLALSVSSISVTMGIAHVIGFAGASFLCFSVGTILCAHALAGFGNED